MIRWVYKTLGGSRAPDIDELEEWKKEGVNTIINLLDGQYGRWLAEQQKSAGFEVIRVPISMYSELQVEEIIPVYEYIDRLIECGKKVVVHCKYGQARSGTVLAGYLIYTGVPYEEAIDTVLEKGFTPSTEPQIEFLKKVSNYKNRGRVKDEKNKGNTP